jgi:hypothetical protein
VSTRILPELVDGGMDGAVCKLAWASSLVNKKSPGALGCRKSSWVGTGNTP